MNQSKTSVQVVYRNYIPLNSPYSSFWTDPPDTIEFDIPKPKLWLKRFFPIYQKFGNHFLVSRMVHLAQKIFFREKKGQQADYLFYVGMLPSEPPDTDYFIDIEHAYSLMNFTHGSGEGKEHIMNLLTHERCKGVVPISQAAAGTLEKFLSDDYAKIRNKVTVIYPALPVYKSRFEKKTDHSIIPRDPSRLNLLYVGKDAWRKGIQEVLPAIERISKKHSHVHLYIVADTPQELQKKYQSHKNIHFYKTEYTSDDVISKFFMPADVFVMPTHADTFGMVYLEALSCGLPVILTKQFATPEIVKDGVNGLFLDHKPLFLDRPGIPKERAGKDYILPGDEEEQIISDLVKKIDMLVEDSNLLEKIRSNATKEFEEGGKFSIDVRNEKMEKIFRKPGQ